MMEIGREVPLAIQAEDLWFAYPRATFILKGLSLEVKEGSFFALLGPSGSGKTTLLKLLAGFLKPQRGRLVLLGRELPSHRGGLPAPLRQKIGYIPQQLGLIRNLTALENALLGSLGSHRGIGPLWGRFPRETVRQAEQYLHLLGIAPKAHQRAICLSGGERQRVAIARTLMQAPRLILADEFVSDLDAMRAIQILSLMRELGKERGITFVVTLHDIQLVREFADTAAVLKEGRLVCLEEGKRISEETLKEMLA